MIKLISGSAAEPPLFGLLCIAAITVETYMGYVGPDSDIFWMQLYAKKLS